MADETTNEATAVVPQEKKKPSVMTLIKAIAFVSVIVLVEIGAAAVLMPTPKKLVRSASS